MQARLSLLLALSSSLLLSACGGGSNSSRAVDAPPATNSNGTPANGVITARFDPTNAVVPFPTNLLLSGTTDLTLNIPVADPTNFGDPQVALNALDGFGTVAPWSTTFSAPPNPATVIPGATVRLFEVTLTGPGGGVTAVVRELQAPQEFVAIMASSDTTGRTLAIVPTAPLKQLTSYMAVLIGNGGSLQAVQGPTITDASGNDVTPDTTYFLAKRTSPLCVNGKSTDPLLPDSQACALEPLRELVNSQEAAVDAFDGAATDQRIVLSWVATTQSITPVMQAVESRIEQAAAPFSEVVPTGLDLSALGVGLPPVANIYVGVLAVPYYLGAPSAADPTAPLHTFWQAAPGAYVPPFDAVGLDPTSTNVTFANPFPVAASTQVIPVLVTVPNANSGQTKPPAGWPVVIFQHGITRNRTDMFAISATLAAQGFAVIAIDAPLHGVTDPTNPFFHNQLLAGTPAAGLITGERTFDLDLENNSTMAPGPDGVIDPSGTYFINLSSLLTSRDNLRQANSDLMELTKAIPTLSYDGITTDFDGSRIEFVGQSLGSIIGTAFMATEPHVNVGLLSVPGGGVAGLLAGSPTFGPIINAGLEQAGITPGTPDYDAFLGAAQTVVDSGDSINFAFATAGKSILAHEVVGDGTAANPPDQVIPNSVPTAPLSGTEPLLAAMGLSSITGTTQAASIRGAVRFTQGSHGSLLDPTASPAATAEMQGEMAYMIASDGTVVVVANPSVIRTQ